MELRTRYNFPTHVRYNLLSVHGTHLNDCTLKLLPLFRVSSHTLCIFRCSVLGNEIFFIFFSFFSNIKTTSAPPYILSSDEILASFSFYDRSTFCRIELCICVCVVRGHECVYAIASCVCMNEMCITCACN